jgi:26S proteasome regulatory subunit N11
MLLNLHKKSWMEGLTLTDYSKHCKLNENIVKEMLELAKNYNKVQLFRLRCIAFWK